MGNSIFLNKNYNSPLRDWTTNKTNEKNLEIVFMRSKKDDKYFYLFFEVYANNLTSLNANIFVVESEIIQDEIAIPLTNISINQNGKKNIFVKFSKNTKFSQSIFEGKLEFKATITCDGLSAETNEFYLGYIKNIIPTTTTRKENNAFQVCPIDPQHRSHFVLHCTAGNMSLEAIKKLTKYDTKKRARSKAHAYVFKDGTILQIWPFSEKNVWATKIESKKGLKGQMFYIELNYGSPDKPSNEQYDSLARLYIEASTLEKCWPIIVPHIEVDRGLADGHSDPIDFDYNYFYNSLKQKGVPIDSIPKFDHNRYWGDASYKLPWGSDKNNWPPILTGNPHK